MRFALTEPIIRHDAVQSVRGRSLSNVESLRRARLVPKQVGATYPHHPLVSPLPNFEGEEDR